jgi:hypothetical protein
MMKKIKKLFSENIKTVIAFTLGMLISGGVVYAATTIASSQVSYTPPTGSGLTSTDVQGALDELFTMANNIVPIDPDTFTTNSTKTVYASSKGVCIKRNNKLNCFKINNWNIEKEHVQQVFSDIICYVNPGYVDCEGSDLYCHINSSGLVGCVSPDMSTGCYVDSDKSISCM